MHIGSHTIPSRTILGVPIAVLNLAEAVKMIVDGVNDSNSTTIAFANANLLLKARRSLKLRQQLSEMVVLSDGIGVDIASWLLYGKKFPANLNGTDLTPEILKKLPRRTPVFLYGTRPEVLAGAADELRLKYKSNICGTCDGFQSDPHAASREINRTKAEVVLVALGNPRQEQWMSEKETRSGILKMGIGAYLDFVSGVVPRAPLWIQRARCEWLYRFMQEPKRLWRRYTVDIVCFLTLVVADRMKKLSR